MKKLQEKGSAKPIKALGSSLSKIAVLSLFSLAAISMNGCLSTSQSTGTQAQDNTVLSDPNVDPALKHEEASFFSKSGAVACGTGAAIGALACLLISDSNTRAACIAAGAAAGCALGMGTNYLLDTVRADYATTEEQLDATAEQVKKDLATTRNLRENASEVLASDKAEIDKLQREYKRGVATKSDLEKKNTELTANIKYLEKQKDEAENRLSQAQQTRDTVLRDAGGNDALAASEKNKLRELDDQIAALRKEIDAVNANLAEYTVQRESLRV